jgi:ferritin-like metal-binding protein YciE
MTDNMEKLLVEGLQEMYYAEQQLESALETMAEQTENEEASQGFSEHREETQEQVQRLEQVFEQIGQDSETREEQVVKSLIEEHEAFAEDNDGEVLDRYNMATGQKVEHYEIAAYGNLTSLAGKAGYDDAADLLSETLDEEEAALEEVTQVSEQFDEREISSD